jgi:hypothetical protein
VTNDCGSATSDAATLTVRCAADFNGDGLVDTRDFVAFLNAWTASDPAADMNQDGTIDSRDVILYVNVWSSGC